MIAIVAMRSDADVTTPAVAPTRVTVFVWAGVWLAEGAGLFENFA
jgi:hypothetical protein